MPSILLLRLIIAIAQAYPIESSVAYLHRFFTPECVKGLNKIACDVPNMSVILFNR